MLLDKTSDFFKFPSTLPFGEMTAPLTPDSLRAEKKLSLLSPTTGMMVTPAFKHPSCVTIDSVMWDGSNQVTILSPIQVRNN